MGAPLIPHEIDRARLKAVTLRSVAIDKAESESFPFLSDSGEYLVDDPDDRELILAVEPGAKFYAPHGRLSL